MFVFDCELVLHCSDVGVDVGVDMILQSGLLTLCPTVSGAA